jgi:hypothetical protein
MPLRNQDIVRLANLSSPVLQIGDTPADSSKNLTQMTSNVRRLQTVAGGVWSRVSYLNSRFCPATNAGIELAVDNRPILSRSRK